MWYKAHVMALGMMKTIVSHSLQYLGYFVIAASFFVHHDNIWQTLKYNNYGFADERLHNFEIRVEANDVTPVFGRSDLGLCYYETGTVGSGATVTYTCTAPLIGRYVTVQSSTGVALQLCELEVYATRKLFKVKPVFRNYIWNFCDSLSCYKCPNLWVVMQRMHA